jgi:dCTP deaminase
MSILTGPEIKRHVEYTRNYRAGGGDVPPIEPLIEITPFDPSKLGPNSYDVHLAPVLKVYAGPCHYLTDPDAPWVLDPNKANPTADVPIPPEGLILRPGTLYLAATVEETYCEGLVPYLDGRSSMGRLGLSIHVTAGRGDDGFRGRWTCEMTVVHHLRVYPGMRIGQLTFHTIQGERLPYKGRYQNASGPEASKYHEKQ